MHRDFPVRCEGNEGYCWGLERAKSGGSGGLGGENNRIRGRIGREEEKGNHRGRAPLFYAAWLAFTLALALAGLGANDWETGTSTQSQSLSLSLFSRRSLQRNRFVKGSDRLQDPLSRC